MKALRRTPALVAPAATIAGLLAGGLLALLHGVHPLEAIRVLVQGALACPTLDRCNLLVTFQFSTPLILTGLSAAVAMQSGLFSLGQAGQMALGPRRAPGLGLGALWFIPTVPRRWRPLP